MREAVRAGLILAVIVMSACDAPDGPTDAGEPGQDAASGHDATVEPVCTPGESRACTCTSGAAGAQLCAEDGSHLEACVCSEPDAGREIDAGYERDAGPPPDAGPPEGECWLGLPGCGMGDGCPAGQTCRRTHLETDPSNVDTGAPACHPAGALREHSGTPCLSSEDCGCSLFCHLYECLRYCDPDGAPCPDTEQGTPQHCVTDSSGIYYCHFSSTGH